ncbi:MAG: hypothetical protein KDA24_02420 [Deltaproteobacteria bacterium]|nr:hypothetical protein [Deltaproteobacteria bacterium]
MLSPLRLLAAAFHGVHLMVRPGHLPAIFGLVGAMNTPAQLVTMREHLRTHPRAAAALDSPFHLSLDVDALGRLPTGTLGRAFAEFTTREGVEPRVLTDKALGETDWVPMHLYEVHDIWHVVTGIGTDVVSEVEILAFMLAQLPHTRMAPLAIAIAMARGALGHRDLAPSKLQAAFVRGTQLGERADLFFGVDWSKRWDTPLSEVRAELGVQVEMKEPAALPAA